MRTKSQIKALFLLGIFILISFHQIIPHAHHAHGQEKKEVAHHHHSGEDHHHEKKQEDKQGSFLSYLLAIHSHTSTSNEIPVIKEYSENVGLQKIEAKKKTSNKCYSDNFVLADQDSKSFEIYQPAEKYFDPYLSFLSLRGPPHLI
ncbi:hypothetical protein OQ279_08860 [Salinimicrobium sp. MT39]|uniref:Uncharacterized protein n=1 Tax=Salinimicrobium profundisediminis TaxID=2994553 RepID=A0A9X3CWK4_9FLAO|nr:hypothetical protein [Salinimicrobium profundisediminis]